MYLERYCACGAKLRRVVPREEMDVVLAVWFAMHSGAGHAPATRKEAQEARDG
jgi:hypothetical protein